MAKAASTLSLWQHLTYFCWMATRNPGINSPVEVKVVEIPLFGVFSTKPGGWEWDFWLPSTVPVDVAVFSSSGFFFGKKYKVGPLGSL